MIRKTIAVALAWNCAVFHIQAVAQPASPEAAPIGNPSDWIAEPDYPLLASLNGKTGITAFKLTVDPKGIPTSCDIAASSGDDELDKKACALLLQRARFQPPIGKNGKPIASTFASRVRWTLPGNPTNPTDNTRSMTWEAELNPQGVVDRCQLIQKDDFVFRDAPNPCSNMLGKTITRPGVPLPRLRARFTHTVVFDVVDEKP
ncbi:MULTISPECIES: energy transducer TonB [unclassified Sphingobium]|uniref:energy transducer TonB n=1 Tax=unclassified Sphingobium TaxID=2611147 RepID=UPI000B2C7F9F|nr:energy transducer TonB [Sphingobium sp. TKS]NML91381.1 energy transducer TonB [Sphingobium sp. TB-6]